MACTITSRRKGGIPAKVRRFRQKMGRCFGAGQDEAQDALLSLLCDVYSRYLGAQTSLNAEGMVTSGRAGELRRHPAWFIEKDCRGQMIRLFAELAAGRDNGKARREAADQELEDALCD